MRLATLREPSRAAKLTPPAAVRGLIFFRPAARLALAAGLATGALVYGGNSKPAGPAA